MMVVLRLLQQRKHQLVRAVPARGEISHLLCDAILTDFVFIDVRMAQDSVCGVPLFRAPIGRYAFVLAQAGTTNTPACSYQHSCYRNMQEWYSESLAHGWPSFRYTFITTCLVSCIASRSGCLHLALFHVFYLAFDLVS